MTRLGRYIFDEAFRPFVFFVAALAAIVWLSQSLRYVNVIVDQGQSAGMFFYLIVLMLPSLLIFVLPAALLFATFYALFRLQGDSELVVISAAGRSRFAVAWPLVILAGLVALLHLAVNLYLMPLGQRTLKDRMFEIRGDLVSNVLREGQFTTPSDGLTVYVRERSGTNSAKGILVHDNREPAKATTYMAEAGEIVAGDAGPRFVLVNGNVQKIEAPGRIATLQFDSYVIDLAPFQSGERGSDRGLQERYLGELLNPQDPELKPERRRSLFAEAHERLSSPLYSFVFVLIPAATILAAGSARRSIALRIGMAALIALAVRMAGLGVRGAVGNNNDLWPLLYIVPLLGIAFGIVWLSGFSSRRRIPAGPPAEAPA
ncbi:hypothetical protein sos41_28120 [Alphaproteobacteria bacterium SO-S41]|nr:hypothetical protein sos41_28120 [Alphaproteobacteria bacterium SO-S41]